MTYHGVCIGGNSDWEFVQHSYPYMERPCHLDTDFDLSVYDPIIDYTSLCRRSEIYHFSRLHPGNFPLLHNGDCGLWIHHSLGSPSIIGHVDIETESMGLYQDRIDYLSQFIRYKLDNLPLLCYPFSDMLRMWTEDHRQEEQDRMFAEYIRHAQARALSYQDIEEARRLICDAAEELGRNLEATYRDLSCTAAQLGYELNGQSQSFVGNGEPAYGDDIPGMTLDEFQAWSDALIGEVRESS